MSYAKLFSTITDSSLWSSTKEARLLFVSMLARADAVGFVEAALPGLARMANLSLVETESALTELMAPDAYSKSPEAGGRRVIPTPGGWCLTNYESYRMRRDEEDRREYMREYMAQYRKRPVNSSKLSKPKLAQAEGEAAPEAEEKEEREENAPSPSVMDVGEETKRQFLKKRGAILKHKGEDLFPEWDLLLGRLDSKTIVRIFKESPLPIRFPSEFRAACK